MKSSLQDNNTDLLSRKSQADQQNFDAMRQSLQNLDRKSNALHDKERRVMEIRKRNQLYDMKMRLDGHGVMNKSQKDQGDT